MPCRETESTADKSVVVTGDDLLHLFQESVFCMFALMSEPKRKEGILPAVVVRVRATGIDAETLLVAFLEEVLYIHETIRLYPYIVVVTELAKESMDGELFVDADIVFADCAEPEGSKIKAVTFHDLKFVQAIETVSASITFDV